MKWLEAELKRLGHGGPQLGALRDDRAGAQIDQVELREVPRVDATVAFGSEAQRFEVEEEDGTAAEGVEAELIGEGEQTVHEPPAQEGDGVEVDGARAVAAHHEPLGENHQEHSAEEVQRVAHQPRKGC